MIDSGNVILVIFFECSNEDVSYLSSNFSDTFMCRNRL